MPVNTPGPSLLDALKERVVVADGAMGTMLQAADLNIDDFAGLEGCNEILNVTRPDVVRGVHDAYFRAGSDAVETNTFGANWANLAEYDIVHRIRELAQAGAVLAKEVAADWSTPDRPRWVLGSIGPGTKLPTLGHVHYAVLRDAYQEQAAGMIDGGVDAIIVETCARPAPGEGGNHRQQARDGGRRRAPPADRPRNRGDNRNDAARLARSARR